MESKIPNPFKDEDRKKLVKYGIKFLQSEKGMVVKVVLPKKCTCTIEKMSGDDDDGHQKYHIYKCKKLVCTGCYFWSYYDNSGTYYKFY